MLTLSIFFMLLVSLNFLLFIDITTSINEGPNNLKDMFRLDISIIKQRNNGPV